MRLHVPDTKFIVTQQTDDHGVSSIHIGNIDTGPVCELLVTTGEHVEVSRDSFVHQHIPGFGAEELVQVEQGPAPISESPAYDGLGRFRKRPVVIEAVQWDGGDSLAACQALSPHRPNEDVKIYVNPAAAGERLHTLSVETLEGRMIAQPGDWIIRGVKGEVYPCKPDIFAATYEAVN